jgi:hypothetical protein
MQPSFFARASNASLPEDAVVRVANRAATEKTKKKKDDKKARKVRREWAKLDWGKQCQGSEEKEDKEDNEVEEEGDDDKEEAEGDDGVQWDAPRDDVVDLSLLQLADEDLELSLRALGPFPYHVEGNGPSKPMEIRHSALSGPLSRERA